MVLESLLILVFPAAMAFAGAMDLLTMTIPNRISIALVAAFAVVAAWSGVAPDVILIKHVALGAAVLAAGVVMFSAGWMGGGDAKLLAAASLWLGYDLLLQFLVVVSLLGGVLALLILAYRRAIPEAAMISPVPEWAQRLHVQGTGIPYGIAIAGGAVAMYPSSPWFLAMLH